MAGTASPNGGTAGRLQAPLATTTVRHRISPALVVTRYPSSVASHRRHVGSGTDRSVRGDGEAIDEVDHFAHRHVAVGVRAVVAMAGQAAQPVGRQQPQ